VGRILDWLRRVVAGGARAPLVARASLEVRGVAATLGDAPAVAASETAAAGGSSAARRQQWWKNRRPAAGNASRAGPAADPGPQSAGDLDNEEGALLGAINRLEALAGRGLAEVDSQPYEALARLYRMRGDERAERAICRRLSARLGARPRLRRLGVWRRRRTSGRRRR
jgi:hypothetical protein